MIALRWFEQARTADDELDREHMHGLLAPSYVELHDEWLERRDRLDDYTPRREAA